MQTPRSITALWLILLLSTATLSLAWFFQLGLGYIPCKLCLEQRIPYYIGISITFLALLFVTQGAPLYFARGVLWLLAALFFLSAGMGLYHAGIEWNFWPGPAECGSNTALLPSRAVDLMGAISASHVVSCTQAAVRLFGISMAGLNAFVSLFTAVISIYGTRINT